MEQTSKLGLSNLVDDVSALLERKKDLLVLNIAEKVSIISSSVASAAILLVLGVFFLFFGGIALAWWIGESLHSIPLGFCIVTAFFALIMVLTIFVGKKLITNAVIDLLIKKIVHDKEQDK